MTNIYMSDRKQQIWSPHWSEWAECNLASGTVFHGPNHVEGFSFFTLRLLKWSFLAVLCCSALHATVALYSRNRGLAVFPEVRGFPWLTFSYPLFMAISVIKQSSKSYWAGTCQSHLLPFSDCFSIVTQDSCSNFLPVLPFSWGYAVN